MSTELLEICRGFKWTYYRRNCASSWSLTRISFDVSLPQKNCSCL